MVDDEAGGGDVGLHLVGADNQRPHRGAGRAGDPGRPQHDEEHHGRRRRGTGSTARAGCRPAGTGSRGRWPPPPTTPPAGPTRRHRTATVAIRAAPLMAMAPRYSPGPARLEDPHERRQQVQHRRPGMMEPVPAVRPDQLVEMGRPPGAQLEQRLIPVQHHVRALHDDPDRLRRRAGRRPRPTRRASPSHRAPAATVVAGEPAAGAVVDRWPRSGWRDGGRSQVISPTVGSRRARARPRPPRTRATLDGEDRRSTHVEREPSRPEDGDDERQRGQRQVELVATPGAGCDDDPVAEGHRHHRHDHVADQTGGPDPPEDPDARPRCLRTAR